MARTPRSWPRRWPRLREPRRDRRHRGRLTSTRSSRFASTCPSIRYDEMRGFLQKALHGVGQGTLNEWQAVVVGAEANPRRVKAYLSDLYLYDAEEHRPGLGANWADFMQWHLLVRVAPADFVETFKNMEDQKITATAPCRGREEVGERGGQPRLREVPALPAAGARTQGDSVQQLVHAGGFGRVHVPGRAAEADAGRGPRIAGGAADRSRSKGAPPARAREGRCPEGHRVGRAGARASPRDHGGSRGRWHPVCQDPRWRVHPGQCGGQSRAGDDEKPQQVLSLPDYWISLFPVTNEQFAAYVQAAKPEVSFRRAGRSRPGTP